MLGGLRTTTTRCSSSSIFLKNLYFEFMDVLFIYNYGKGKFFPMHLKNKSFGLGEKLREKFFFHLKRFGGFVNHYQRWNSRFLE